MLGRYIQTECPSVTYQFEEPLTALASVLEKQHGEDANVSQKDLEADVVTLLDVLEHQADDREFLKGLIDRMRPGSLLVVTVPALGMLWSSWDEALGHHRRYNRRSLHAAFDSLPIEVEEVSYLFPELVIPAVARRTFARGPRVGTDSMEEASEFPRLPTILDRVLYLIGVLTQMGRGWWPFGSSLIAVVRKR